MLRIRVSPARCQGLTEMRFGQLWLAFGLEHQRQRGVGIGIAAVECQGSHQWSLGLPGQTLLQITQAQLHVGPPGLFAPLATGQRVTCATRHAAGQQRKRQDRQRGAQGHGRVPSVARGVVLALCIGAQLAHGDVALAATGAIHDLADQLTTGGIDVFAAGSAGGDIEATVVQQIWKRRMALLLGRS